VDAQAATFSVETLRRWKSEHEAWVFSRLEQATPGIGFAELEVVCNVLLDAVGHPSDQFVPTAPHKKMQKNGLTDSLLRKLQLGLSMFNEVEAFIQGAGRLNPQFPERLKAGFVGRFNDFSAHDVRGDALFEALQDFASAGNPKFERQAAGLAVLCYLFQKCEVFEP
jgi:hypothetical protein